MLDPSPDTVYGPAIVYEWPSEEQLEHIEATVDVQPAAPVQASTIGFGAALLALLFGGAVYVGTR